MLNIWASQQRSNNFVPGDLGAKLLAWWDVEDAATLTLTGSQISGWRDKVTNTNLTQGIGGSRPLYQATSFNGRPAAFFDGIDDTLEIASVFLPSGDAHSEIYILVDAPLGSVDTASRAALAYGGTTGATSRGVRRSGGDGTGRLVALTNNTAVTLTTVLFEGRQQGLAISSPTTVTARVGSEQASVAAVPATGTVRTRIGAGTTGTPANANFWLGLINSIIVTSELTEPERNNLFGFLQRRI